MILVGFVLLCWLCFGNKDRLGYMEVYLNRVAEALLLWQLLLLFEGFAFEVSLF